MSQRDLIFLLLVLALGAAALGLLNYAVPMTR
jgi:hypothetical protein